MELLLALAVLPAAALMYYVYRKDKVEKEPMKLVGRLFLFGVLAGPLAAIVENIFFAIFESVVPEGVILLILEYFIGVAAVEEGFKYLFLNTIRKNHEFNYVFDGIVYGVAVSLGFATLENILYVFGGGIEVAIMRAIFSVPGHAAGGVLMGCFFGLARQREVRGNKAGARSYYILAFVLPWIEHGFYDTALSTEIAVFVILALVVELAFIIFGFVLVNRMSKKDAAIYPNGVQPGMQAGMQPGMQAGMQPGMQPGMPAGVPYTAQPPMQPGVAVINGMPVQQPAQAGQPVYQQPVQAGQPMAQPGTPGVAVINGVPVQQPAQAGQPFAKPADFQQQTLASQPGQTVQQVANPQQFEPQPQAQVQAAEQWVCPNCGISNTSKFCVSCGTPRL